MVKGYISIQQRPPTESTRLYPSNSVHPPRVRIQGYMYIHPTASTHRESEYRLYPSNSAWFQHDSNIACPVSDKLHVQALTVFNRSALINVEHCHVLHILAWLPTC